MQVKKLRLHPRTHGFLNGAPHGVLKVAWFLRVIAELPRKTLKEIRKELPKDLWLFKETWCFAVRNNFPVNPYDLGVPAVIAVVYGVLRESLDNEGCWVSPSVNVVLMSRILYILVKKLQHDPHLERMQYKKAVRAAVILIPVFGLQFLFTIYRLPDLTHQVINLVLDGLQGCAVSIIFCYTNKSVWDCARKWWKGPIGHEEVVTRNESRPKNTRNLQYRERVHSVYKKTFITMVDF
ncbi:hypothetical protein TELCIR_10850 [Teladorsagia circumcincta]|uniref:G-protein coupled receptors family 2 profile 2 domain-containing protein n=1 Tax=Teladorsagia circumcincta TaxID=45464 RepID=A0A2G9UCE0_TELCI|nr:hypothetical protein TELCIR_10850 [Teladorsagia circumcincta]